LLLKLLTFIGFVAGIVFSVRGFISEFIAKEENGHGFKYLIVGVLIFFVTGISVYLFE